MRDAIEVKINSDMPLPIPRSVISSPIHMIAAVPAVITITRVIRVIGSRPLMTSLAWEQPANICPLSASAMKPVDCRTPSPIVMYRVCWVILACPA